ncbi:thiol-specific monooxygenase [Colletotrichum orchidophilum]|uniref:Thiol-specific monooxygenase n=1 Tax=Colletotrichum orchidophilum TaxID=1209926 RepID=A0A1G4BP91_9PEZI|nr:thiol-specific monooxygenase [Colletotrichum orchidophilum]OHF03118.1 thiol-specific monooxygenase [Colletotrichum orchidophilum]
MHDPVGRWSDTSSISANQVESFRGRPPSRPRTSSVLPYRYFSIPPISRFSTTPPRVNTRSGSAAIMSPMYLEDKLNIDRVAVIGAGPCGLAAAKYLLAEKKFSKVQIFEQRDTVGGLWTYSSLNVIDGDFSIPRTQPTENPDTAIAVDGHDAKQFVSPVYDYLETNIPHTLMNYSDTKFPSDASLFPSHQTVKKYLEDYAKELKPIISLSTQILSVRKSSSDKEVYWEIESRDLKTDETSKARFDAVFVASGHYNDPFIPDIPGLADFDKAHPGSISHSKFYMNAAHYEGKKVIIVGNSASGIDLSAQISTVCKLPIIVSEKTVPNTPAEDRSSWAKSAPEILEFIPETRQVRFANGVVESDIDSVVFCTGYFYSFPFLRNLSPPVVTDGAYARNLYEHLLYIDDPTLAFAGIPQRIVPFPVSEGQAAYVARAWADRLRLPSLSKMREWEARMLKEKGEGKILHNLAFPKDLEYINMLHARSLEAENRPALLENDGVGKMPPFWDDEKRWTRERFPLIKIASRKLGEKRHEVTTLEELGFDYKAWKAGLDEEGKLL